MNSLIVKLSKARLLCDEAAVRNACYAVGLWPILNIVFRGGDGGAAPQQGDLGGGGVAPQNKAGWFGGCRGEE